MSQYEFEVGESIERMLVSEFLTRDFSPGEGSINFYGLAVEVETRLPLSDDYPDNHGIVRTEQLTEKPIGQTSLKDEKGVNVAKGTIHAIDRTHNTLWLIPRFFSLASRNLGHLAAVRFYSASSLPNFHVTVRSPDWRDVVPGKYRTIRGREIRRYAYSNGMIPKLSHRHWYDLGIYPYETRS